MNDRPDGDGYVDFSPELGTQVKLNASKNGEQCPYIFADDDPKDKVANRLKGLCLLRMDLQFAAEMSNLICLQESSFATLGFWQAGIAAYGRCFVSTNGRPILQSADVRRFDASFEEFHRHIIDLRHRYVAHADNHNRDFFKVVVTLAPYTEQKRILEIGCQGFQSVGPSHEEVQKFHMLCLGLDAEVEKKCRKAIESLHDSYRGKNIDDLYNQAIV